MSYILISGDADDEWRRLIIISGKWDGSCDPVNLFFSSQSINHCTILWFLLTLSLRIVCSTFCVKGTGSCGRLITSFSKSDSVTSWCLLRRTVDAVQFRSYLRLTSKISSSSESSSSKSENKIIMVILNVLK